MPSAIIDWLQNAGIIGSIIAFFKGYGALKERVENIDEEGDRFVTKDSFEGFQDEVLRRLKRIESKQDRFLDGRSRSD